MQETYSPLGEKQPKKITRPLTWHEKSDGFRKQFQLPDDLAESQLSVLEERLQTYLATEKLFKEFFSNLDYCVQNCITKKMSLNSKAGNIIPGYIGCCHSRTIYRPVASLPGAAHAKYTDASFLMAVRRDEKYGIGLRDSRPMQPQRCDYHSDAGCILNDHKPPLCIAYFCHDLRLEKEYNINYEFGDVFMLMKSILMFDIEQDTVKKFQSRIIQGTKAIKNKEKPSKAITIGKE